MPPTKTRSEELSAETARLVRGPVLMMGGTPTDLRKVRLPVELREKIAMFRMPRR
jgi:hypothetical protein